jgi:hypothetical protein
MGKAITFASLTIAITVLIPASALGNAKGTDRPAKVTFSDTSVVNLERFTFHYAGTELNAHLGKSTVEGEGSFFLTGFNTFDQSDSFVVTAANGDKVFGTDANMGEGSPEGLLAGNTQTTTTTITGGTGRFVNATGTLTGTLTSVLVSLSWPFATYKRSRLLGRHHQLLASPSRDTRGASS